MKLLLAEHGTAEARALWSDAVDRVTASVAFVEVRSAIARRLRGRAREWARRSLAERWQECAVVEVDDGLLRLAAAAADEHRLTALDAIHLAAGWLSEEGELVFATWDDELRRAARASGLTVAPYG